MLVTKKLNTKLIAAAVAGSAAIVSMQAYSATQNMQADVQIVVALTFSNPVNLDFGLIEDSIATSNTIVLSSAGAISGSGSASHISGESAGSNGSYCRRLQGHSSPETQTGSRPAYSPPQPL